MKKKVKIISAHLSDKALLWHRQYLSVNGKDVNWEVYKNAIVQRFGSIFEDPMSALKNAKYDKSAKEYQDFFDTHLCRFTISKKHAISLYFGRLPTELEMSVRMFKPATLADAYSLTSTRFGNGGNYGNASKPALLPKPNTPVNNSVNAPVRKQLSQKEYQEKKAQNLCFYCDQKYAPGHKCAGQIFSLVLVPDEEDCFEDRLEEDNIEHTIHILVDCGSTHNFVDVAVANKSGCHIRSICPLSVTVGDSYNVATISECKQFKWQLQWVNFCSDVMLLTLVGCEMIFGIQWLSTLGDIKCNFEELRMEFVYKSKKMVLRGTPKSNSEWMTGNKQNKMERQCKQPAFSSMQLCVFPSAEVSLMRMEGISEDLQPELQDVVEEFADVFAVPN
ncbi:RNA-directed DNA polymerase like protein [Tanacetum coccineum]|uniref:RNA-directed DNA polymerase like protein n=1 Tax=Tanacetum coccineum TaxID=301880 RepID=A0ABQ5IPI1_9ASTR